MLASKWFCAICVKCFDFSSCAAICIYIIYACVETTDACKN